MSLSEDEKKQPLTRGEFFDWVDNRCHPRFEKMEGIIKNGLQGEISTIKNQIKWMFPIVIAILGLVIAAVSLVLANNLRLGQ